MTTPVIELHGVSKFFGGVRAVRDVSFCIERGGIVALIGPNGAGKSTLFDLISGVQRLDAGRRVLSGRDMSRASSHHIAGVGVSRTFQKVRLFDSMTVLENVVVGGLLTNHTVQAAEEAGHSALRRVGIHGRAAAAATDLTLIDRKRLEMARALAAGPDVLLLDEVMAGLTPTEIEDAVALIRQLTDEGVTVFLVEHLLKVVMRISRRILVLDHGQLIADGTPDQMRGDAAVIEAYIGTSLDSDQAGGGDHAPQ